MAYGGLTAPATPNATGGYQGMGTPAPVAPTQPTTAQKIGAGVTTNFTQPLTQALSPISAAAKGAYQGMMQTPTAPKDGKIVSATIDAFKGAIAQSGDNIRQYTDTVNSKGLFSVPGAVAEGQIGVSLVNGVFGAALSPLQGLAHVPVLGTAVDAVNKIFGAIGEGAGAGAVETLNNTPLPPETKATLTPLVHDAAALVAQIYAGKAGGDVVGMLKDKTTAITDAIHKGATDVQKTIPVTSETPTELPVPLKTGEGNLITKQPEPYTPPDQLPTIQMGPKAPSDLPSIQTEAPTPKVKGDLTIEPIKQPEQIQKPTENAPVVSETPKLIETPTGRTTQTLKPIEGTGDIKARGLSQSIEATAIEKKLTNNFGDLPEYKQVSMADQATRAAELITKDPAMAKEIALGNKAPPKGLLPESVLVAVEHDATVKGDVQTLMDLANSKLASSATTMGQRIRALGERDSTSPTEAIRQVQEARQAALEKRGANIKEQTISRIKESVKKANTPKTWADFVESITC